MDYIQAFKNLRNDINESSKTPHKAILLLTVIEMYENDSLTFNKILFDETLKSSYLKVWERYVKKD